MLRWAGSEGAGSAHGSCCVCGGSWDPGGDDRGIGGNCRPWLDRLSFWAPRMVASSISISLILLDMLVVLLVLAGCSFGAVFAFDDPVFKFP